MPILFLSANPEVVLAATRGLQVLRAAAAVEGAEVASGVGVEVLAAGASEFVIWPIAIAAGCFYLAEKYKPQTPMPPLFAPRRSTLWEMDHQRLKDYLSQPTPDLKRQLEILKRERHFLKWYDDGDQRKIQRLDERITALTVQIADAEREAQIVDLENRLKNLNPLSTEAQQLRQQITQLQSAMGSAPAAVGGVGAHASTSAIPPPPMVIPPPPTVDEGKRLEDESNDLALRLAVLRRYSNRSRRSWDDLAAYLENTPGNLRDKLPQIRVFVESEEARLGETRLRQAPPKWEPEPITIPPYLYSRLAGAYGDPNVHVTIADLSRAFNYYFGDMGGLPPSRSRNAQFKDTQQIVYSNTVHRALSHLGPLSDVEMRARDQVTSVAQAASMVNFGGHWWALGIKMVKSDRRTIPSTLRLYLPIRPEHADEVMAAMNAMVSPYVRTARDVQYKMAQDPREWRGDDGNLVYTGRAAYHQVWRKMRALELQHPEWFHAPIGTPMVARLLDEEGRPTNISIAQSPPDAAESVNGQVSSKASKALQWYRLQRARNLQPNVDDAIQMIARRLKEEGRDLAHPAYLARDQDTGLPGWMTYLDVHVHTDQFFAEDVPQVLAMLETYLNQAQEQDESGVGTTQILLNAYRNRRSDTTHVARSLAEVPPLANPGPTVQYVRDILATVMRRYP